METHLLTLFDEEKCHKQYEIKLNEVLLPPSTILNAQRETKEYAFISGEEKRGTRHNNTLINQETYYIYYKPG